MMDRMLKVPVAPPILQSQREAGYLASLAVRQARAQLKAELKAGRPLAEVIATHPEILRGMKVHDLLRAVPGVGQKKALRVLQAAGVAVTRTVGQIGPHQMKRILSNVLHIQQALARRKIS